jgi:hypothetical protein
VLLSTIEIRGVSDKIGHRLLESIGPRLSTLPGVCLLRREMGPDVHAGGIEPNEEGFTILDRLGDEFAGKAQVRVPKVG